MFIFFFRGKKRDVASPLPSICSIDKYHKEKQDKMLIMKNKSPREPQDSKSPPTKLLKLETTHIPGTLTNSTAHQSPHISSSIVHSTTQPHEFKITHPPKSRAVVPISPKISEQNVIWNSDKSKSSITQSKKHQQQSILYYKNKHRVFEHEMDNKSNSYVFESDASIPITFGREPEYINNLEKEYIWDEEYFNDITIPKQNSASSNRQIPTSSLYSFSYQDKMNSEGNLILLSIIILFSVLFTIVCVFTIYLVEVIINIPLKRECSVMITNNIRNLLSQIFHSKNCAIQHFIYDDY